MTFFREEGVTLATFSSSPRLAKPLAEEICQTGE